MIKLAELLENMDSETYEIKVLVISKADFNITDILDEIRGIQKVTIVNNETPPEMRSKSQTQEYTKIGMKFVTRTSPQQTLEQIKEDILSSKVDIGNDQKVEGVLQVRYNIKSLKKVE